jgi:hypothetical protein
MENFDNILELNDFIRTTKEKGLTTILTKSEVIFKFDGKKISDSMVKVITGLNVPVELFDFMKELELQQKTTASEESSIPMLSEQETWDKINPCFDIGKNGNFVMTNAPEWDDMLKERFDYGLKEVSTNGLILSIKTFYNYFQKKKMFNPIIDRELMCQKFDERMITRRMSELKTLSSVMEYKPQDRDYLKEWLIAMECENIDVSLDMFRHWLWLVKRNMFGYEVRFEILMVLRSLSHGIGKSWSINYLTGPLSKFVIHPGLGSITEERSIALDSANNLVLDFDELAGAERSQIEELKKWVTSPNMTYRPMGTNASTNVRKLATGIGTSNRPIAQFIKDNTGNRRFVELILKTKVRPEITKTPEFQKDGEAWLSMWKNIDETKADGYYNPEVNEKQKLFVQSCLSSGDILNKMFEDLFNWKAPSIQKIRSQQLYNLYKKYCSENKQMPVQLENFKVGLHTIIDSNNYDIKKTNSNNTQWYRLPTMYDYWYEDLCLGQTTLKDIKLSDTKINLDVEEEIKPFKRNIKQVDFT